MVEKTPRLGLNKYEQGDTDWNHADTVEAIDENAIKHGPIDNRPRMGEYDDELYHAIDQGITWRWDASEEDWQYFSGHGSPDTPVPGTSHLEAISTETLRTTIEPHINVKAYGAVGDGTTDDTAAIQAAADTAEGGTLYFPPTDGDQYRITDTIGMPGYLDVEGATGTEVLHDGPGGTHAFLWENEKRIRWNGPSIRFGAADQLGLGLHGMWFAEINSLSIRNSTDGGYEGVVALDVLSSKEGTTDWGAYCINVNNPEMFMNAGHAGIQTGKATNDTMSVTHLNVYGGWIHGPDYGMDLEDLDVGYVEWIALENLEYGIRFTDSVGVTVNPGETTNITNQTYKDGGGNGVMQLNRPHHIGSGSTDLPHYTRYGRNEIQLAPTNDISQDYGVRIESRYEWQDAFSLAVKDSTDWQELLHYGDGVGMTLSGGTGDINLLDDLDFDGCKEKEGRTEYGSTRPDSPSTGQRFFDTSFGQPIWYNGTEWVDANGSPI